LGFAVLEILPVKGSCRLCRFGSWNETQLSGSPVGFRYRSTKPTFWAKLTCFLCNSTTCLPTVALQFL